MTHARTLLVGAVVSLLAVSSIDIATAAAPSDPAPVAVPGITPTAPTSGAAADDVVVLHTNSGADARSAALREAIARLGATVRHTFSTQQTISLQLPAGTDPTATATTATLANLPGVTRVEPPVTRTLDAVPNDQQLSGQRSYLDSIAAPAAWTRQPGSAAVRIAVVDSGVDVAHPDLANKIVGRYNAVDRSTTVTDTVGHGTFVAGVAAASTNNGTGIAGAGYDSSILAVKVADSAGDIAIDDEIAGIRWAADHGAKIINLSLSGTDASTAELRAVQYAQAKGVLVVAAAGNDGDTVRQYPAAYPGVVAVAATDVALRRRASFSSHGSWVTLAAPGVNLLSTTPRAGSDYFPGRSGYARGDGTSFSTPLVAGEAALLIAQNPALTANQVRAALVASAHGYAGNDVGRGQVDFNLALDHVAPATQPTAVLTSGTAGTVDFSALSTAPRVSFRVDDGPWTASVPVVNGTARQPFSSYGYGNRVHTVYAVDCSTFGECNTTAPMRSTTFAPTNPAPSLTVDSSVSGPFTATAAGPDGGGVRLLVDGKEAGFDATSPYTFDVNGTAFGNGTHDLTVQGCSASHSVCDGPPSPATSVVFESLHPAILVLSRTAISPNHDGSGDSAVLIFRTDQPSDLVNIETRDATGTVVRTDAVPTGRAYRWLGLDSADHRLPDGTYRLGVATADSSGRRGLTERAVVVDTRAPRLSGVTGNGTRFFPVRDGYRDAFTPSASLPDGGALAFTVTTSAGRVVRLLRATRPAGRVALAWNGRTAAGRQVPAGLYRWWFTVSDAAGNVTRTAAYRTYVDARRLQTRTVSIVRDARARIVGTARCAGKARSSFRRGVHLVNGCRADSGDVSYTTYTFTLPGALRYTQLSFATYGRSTRTSQLSASFRRSDGGLEVPGAVRVMHAKSRWRTVASVPAAGRVQGRRVDVALVLSSRYAGTNDFDARSVRLRVTLVRLG